MKVDACKFVYITNRLYYRLAKFTATLLFGNRAIGRPLNWPDMQLVEPIGYHWISVKIFSILLCNYNSHRIKIRTCNENLFVTRWLFLI